MMNISNKKILNYLYTERLILKRKLGMVEMITEICEHQLCQDTFSKDKKEEKYRPEVKLELPSKPVIYKKKVLKIIVKTRKKDLLKIPPMDIVLAEDADMQQH